MSTGLRKVVGRLAWHAHPGRPGPEFARLTESQWWPRDRIEAVQVEGLQRLVAAATAVPFYRDRFASAGLSPSDIRSIDDLRRIPVLERQDVDRLGLNGLRRPGSWGLHAASSGSIGKPVHLLWPLSEMQWRDAAEARAHRWLGTETGDRRVEVRCRPVSRMQAAAAALLNAEALHAPTVNDPRVVGRLVRSLVDRPPTLVWGVSNALYTAARAVLDAGQTAPSRSCWSGGNHLHPHYREALGRAFQCRVYERYATMETGLIAHECAEGGRLHVPAEGIIAEIVRADGSAAAPGELGHVLVTSLRNPATPLIRYRVGDQAIAPEAGACRCGRGLPLFGIVAGRTRDVLVTSSGRRINPPELVEAARPAMDRIADFQVRQDREGRIRLIVVARHGMPADSGAHRLAAIVNDLAAPPEPPRIELVDQLDVTPGGKIRTVISDLGAMS